MVARYTASPAVAGGACAIVGALPRIRLFSASARRSHARAASRRDRPSVYRATFMGTPTRSWGKGDPVRLAPRMRQQPSSLDRPHRLCSAEPRGARGRLVQGLQILVGLALVLLECLAGRLRRQQLPDRALRRRHAGGVGPPLGLPEPGPFERAGAVQEDLLDLDEERGD